MHGRPFNQRRATWQRLCFWRLRRRVDSCLDASLLPCYVSLRACLRACVPLFHIPVTSRRSVQYFSKDTILVFKFFLLLSLRCGWAHDEFCAPQRCLRWDGCAQRPRTLHTPSCDHDRVPPPPLPPMPSTADGEDE